MPAVFLDRLPLPSLQAYTSISILLLSCSVYYSLRMTSQPGWELAKSSVDPSQVARVNATFVQKLHLVLINHVALKRVYEIIYYMIQEPLCIWTLINMAYCCLILLGKFIQKLVFGELRVAEQQHIKDKFWNFVFYKFIFIFGVMNVQYMDEVVLWCSWFSVLGFLHLLVQLCKDRYEYLSFSPTTSTLTHVRLFALLFGILSTAGGLFAICIFVGLQTGMNTFCFMGAECTLVVLRTLHVICRYAIHLWDIRHEGVWEKRVTFTYYSDLVFDLAGLSIDFLHHLHMLLWGNILLSMASLVICMQLRYLFNEIQRRVKRHKNYLQVAKYMEKNYPVATPEELESNSDDCAICWDHMDSARKLPCGHLFHTSCLRSWLEQVSTCPTCRMSLITRDSGAQSSQDDINRNNLMGQDDVPQRPINQTMNHFFHFDGSRYVSWFPSFSVEVSHTNLLGVRHSPPTETSQLDTMAYQVVQMFPHIPASVILDDLRVTRSVEHTVENILDERVVLPPTAIRVSSVRAELRSPKEFLKRGKRKSALFQNPHARRERSPSVSTSQSTPENFSSDSSASSNSVLDQASTSSGSATSSFSPSSTSFCHQAAADDVPGMSGERSDSEDAESSTLVSGEGCRFSKSSSEREQMLARRKEELLKRARTKYMSRILRSSSSQGINRSYNGRSFRSSSSSSSSSE